MGKVFYAFKPLSFILGIFMTLGMYLYPCVCKASAGSTTSNSGYITDVNGEVSNEPVELILVESPDHFVGPTFNEKVFNHQLSQEFIFSYQQIFGRTEQEGNYYLVNRQGYFVSAGVLTTVQLDEARRTFAQYMAKRLIEFHGDNIMKTDPQLKKIYNIKQAVSNFSVAAGPQSKFEMNYSFVGNSMNASYTNPYLNLYTLVSMDPALLFPSTPQEINSYVSKSFPRKWKAEVGFLFYAKTFRTTIFKELSPVVSVDYTQTFAMTQNISGVDPSRDSLSLAGLKFIF